ncbi:MAG: hypothetical protein WBL85_02580, partial [Sedimentisphaerales bacterium]
MSRKIVFILALLCFLAISNSAIAAQDNWVGATSSDWFDPTNWGSNVVPTIGDWAAIQPGSFEPIINGDAACSPLDISPWCYGGTGSVDVNSGTCNFGSALNCATWGDFDSSVLGPGILYVHGGTVTTQSDGSAGLVIGSQFGTTTGRVIMYGGLISVPAISLQNGDIALYGGTLECIGDSNFNFSLVRPQNKIDISGGTLQLAGNYLITSPNLPGLIAGKSIVSTRGNIGIPVFDGTNTILVSDSVNMLRPWGPSPDMNSTNVHYRVGDVNVGIMLSWNSGSEPNVINHDVYFGTSTADISAATITSPQFMHEVNEANAEPNQWDVNNFNFKTNTNYYWRVDDNAITSNIYDGSGNIIGSNTTLYKGLVWKFTSHDGKAYNPNPYNGRNGLTEPLAL